jgi:hypothetical protein
LRPRRLREAATLWASLKDERGIEGRDAVWQHPDLLPTAEDLDDPQGFSERRKLAEASDSEVDDALQKLLSGGFDEAADAGPDDSGSGHEPPAANNEDGRQGGPEEDGAPEEGKPEEGSGPKA